MADKRELANVSKKSEGIAAYLNTPAVKENIEGTLGKERALSLISDVVACVQSTPALGKCTNKSILSASLVAKSVNLPLTPQLGYAWLVPYQNKKEVFDENGRGRTEYVDEAQLQIGYKGYVQLALRSPKIVKLVVTDVRKGEIKGYDPFDDHYIMEGLDDFEKRMAKDNKGNWIVPVIGYFAKFELNTGLTKEIFMSYDDMQSHAKKYSKSYRSDLDKHNAYSFWSKNFDDMAKKTMLRQLLGRWGLLTPDIEKAYVSDMAVIDENGNPEYVDNTPDEAPPVVNPMADVIDADIEEIDKVAQSAPFK